MTNPEDKLPGAAASGEPDPIVPIEFTPHQTTARRFSYRFRWFHGLVLVVVMLSTVSGWFVLTAKSVFVEADPITAAIRIEGGLHVRLGRRYLIRPGSYQITLQNEGYHDIVTRMIVGSEPAQTHPFSLHRLPGQISITALDTNGSPVQGARVILGGVDLGATPVVDMPVEPGMHQLRVSRERYLDHIDDVAVEGRSQPQRFEAILAPAWATLSFTTMPAGADIIVDGETVATTPSEVELLQGEREVTLKMAGHKAWQRKFDILAGEDQVLPAIELEPADGLVFIRSKPTGASVTVGDEFQGLTPLEVALAPNREHQLRFFRNGYRDTSRSVRTAAGEETSVVVELAPVTATVQVIAEPADAELYVDGALRGSANQTLELMAVSQRIELRREGFAPYATEFTPRPGLDQVIRVSLKSLEQLRLEQIQPVITTMAGQRLKLFYPDSFTMGASRREAGRRPNEALREIQLQRPFYLAYREVTNGQYRQFDGEHNSGTVQGLTVNNENQPVVRIDWNQAALYCNWLSEQEGLPPFYRVEQQKVVGFSPEATGYRLPSEAEWAWAARSDGSGTSLRYPWGDQLPPPENAGNFADVTARAYLGEVLFDYNDGYLATAPVASFAANHHDLYDLAGNVAEWVHDYYGSVGSGAVEIDPLGPELGQFHTIRGSSWAHGAITELRLSFRDFGAEARDDLGFRVARYLE